MRFVWLFPIRGIIGNWGLIMHKSRCKGTHYIIILVCVMLEKCKYLKKYVKYVYFDKWVEQFLRVK